MFLLLPLKINLLRSIKDGLLLFRVAYNKRGKRLDEGKHFTKSGHTLSSIRISGIFITDTHTYFNSTSIGVSLHSELEKKTGKINVKLDKYGVFITDTHTSTLRRSG